MNACPVCGSAMHEAFRAAMLHRYEGIYDHCDACGFLRVRDPHWLAEAYSDAIAITDTGLMWRNRAISQQLASLLTVLGHAPEDRYLDYAGGYGVLTRLMRDAGYDFYWSDPYCQNLVATGFGYKADRGPCRTVTAFEVLEHVERPREFVETALAAGSADTLVFTTELYSGPPPQPSEWRYYSAETGQHIAFFRRDTLARLAEALGMNFHTSHGLHILSRRQLPLRRIDLALGRLGLLFALWGRRALHSKTMSDHESMVAQSGTSAAEGADARRL
jgi:hypothetical protein